MGDADDTLPPGTTLGRYEIRRQLGRGGMGAVYEAVHKDLKKRVAIKVLSGALASNAEARQRFLREGEAASRIQHPHVVDVTDVGIDGTRSYLVMEFLEGEDLASRLTRGALGVREGIDILLPVCAGLAVAHEEGVIHRDLKPENIFLARRRQGGVEPKLLDFGVSKVIGQEVMALTGTSATFGTPYYMPPEQLRGARQADQRSDVYALGVILYECLCGRRPFQAESIYSMLHAIGSGDYLPPRSLRPDMPPAVEAVIVRAMRLDPAERQPTARAFAAALLPFASETVRLVWSDTFQVDTVPGTPTGAPRVSGLDRTVLSDSAPPPALTPRSFTTLGTATGQQMDQTAGLSGRRRMSPAMAVVGGLVVAGGIAGAVGYSRSKTVDAQRAASRAPVVLVPAPQPVPPPVAPPVPAAPATFKLDLDTEPAGALLELDGVALGPGPVHRELPRDGQQHRLIARAPGREATTVLFVDGPPRSPLVLPSAPVPTPTPAARGKADRAAHSAARAHRDQSKPAAAAVEVDALDVPKMPPAPPAPPAPKPVSTPPPQTGNRPPVLD